MFQKMMIFTKMEELLSKIKQCTECKPYLEHGCNPVVTASTESRVVIIGQAPGRKVHESGIPWYDKSGDNLRSWLNIDKDTFYDASRIALIPMGFCYPGKGKSGDLPPRKECAPLWHERLLSKMPNVKLTLLVGQYAQAQYLESLAKPTLTETVKNYNEYLPAILPLPHPSPRNNIWQAKNPWFAKDLLPQLKHIISEVL